MKPYIYKTCCLDAKGEDINAMRDHPKCQQIRYISMLKHCDLIGWSLKHNYSERTYRGPILRDDPHVSYHKSFYRGEPCYYLVWSAIEFIWVRRIKL